MLCTCIPEIRGIALYLGIPPQHRGVEVHSPVILPGVELVPYRRATLADQLKALVCQRLP
ncbi:Uncharacterised protein [Mycobacteroides abscessus subsp. abscessus]|nr:Uncharacterised protein [Mycobacteroides abscessus subsp. abscessus]